MKILPYLISFGCKIHQIIEKFKESLKNVQKMKKKCIIKVVTGIGNQGQLPWLATLVTKVTTMVTTMVTMMVTMLVTTMVTITNLGYRGCVTDYCLHITNQKEKYSFHSAKFCMSLSNAKAIFSTTTVQS